MENKIKELKEKLSAFSTIELLGMIGYHFITFASDAKDFTRNSDMFNKTDLMSPQKQYSYLAGLLMSTNDLSEGIKNDNEYKYKELEDDVQEITSEYIKNFIDLDSRSADHNSDVIRKNLVSMEAFTSYFDTGILRYEEQTESLMRALYSPFDTELCQLTSLIIDDFISFYHFIYNAFSDSLNTAKNVIQKVGVFLDTLNAIDPSEAYQKKRDFGSNGIGDEIQEAMNGMCTVRVSAIIKKYGEKKGYALIDAFSLKRKERNYCYYNEVNPFATHPLCWVDESEVLFVVHPQFLLNAICSFVTETIENPKNTFAEKYRKTKADITEKIFLSLLKLVFGESAKYHSSVCEERGSKEHDIVVEFENYIIIAEVKGSKVREPFFNPQKAYIRIRDHFFSDSGIGGAYRQAITLKKLIEITDTITLFENRITPFTIDDIAKKVIIPIVLTLNQFGGIAVNTSILIEPENDQPYPWVCNLHDFENIIEINKYLNKTPMDFIEYIIWRILNHKRIISSDELEVIEGYYLDPHVKNIKNDGIFFPPNGPSLMDKIYFENKGIPYYHPIVDEKPRRRKKIGANDRCPCESGEKFKRCCRGKGVYD